MLEIKSFCGGYDNNLFYIVYSEDEALVIDCFDAELVINYLKKHDLRLKYVISTHNHFDHVEANSELLSKTSADLVMHKSNVCDVHVDEGDSIKIGSIEFKVLFTPGHTMDSVCFLAEGNLFTGDTLFVGTIGGIFCDGGEKYQPASIKRLIELSNETVVYPGHDYGGRHTTIELITKHNDKVKNILDYNSI